MTTILFDPKERALYADSQITSGNYIYDNKVKIDYIKTKKLGWCLVASAGVVSQVENMIECLVTGFRVNNYDQSECSCFVLDKKGFVYEFLGDQSKPVKFGNQKLPRFEGSGWIIAKAAYNGCAIDAMNKAKELDIYTGGAITKAYFYKGMPVFETVCK